MSIVVNNQIWQLVEKLYIHCYEKVGFVQFLNSNGVKLPSKFYNGFEIYSFMSTEHYDFAQLMHKVPSYRYIPILQNVCFDENIKSTRKDNWNYYGVQIKTWYPKLLTQLRRCGFKIDLKKNIILFPDDYIDDARGNPDFLQYSFNELFLDYIKKEINESYNYKHYLAVMTLSRKLIECLVKRIFEVVFRKYDENGTYNKANHLLWYDTNRGRELDLNILLENLKNNASAFHEDKDLILDICFLVKPIKDEMNKMIHKDYKIPVKDDIDKHDIKGVINKLGRLFRKYCNP